MTKHSPWLVKQGDNWVNPHEYEIRTKLWFCVPRFARHWDIRDFEFIQIWGSDIQPTLFQTIKACPQFPESTNWENTPRDTFRFSQYSAFLRRFNAPVVYVWIEGTNWEAS